MAVIIPFIHWDFFNDPFDPPLNKKRAKELNSISDLSDIAKFVENAKKEVMSLYSRENFNPQSNFE